jgi:hypothetical protein
MSTEVISTYEAERKKAWRYLRKGIVFFVLFLLVAEIIEMIHLPFTDLLSESSIIVGWVALWRPMEMFLYELPELKQQELLAKK